MLWLALFLPRLPLDARPDLPPAAGCRSTLPMQPRAVVELDRVLVADEAAQAAGVVPGLRLASARARLPELVALPRDPAQEAAALARLACWAGSFTSEVSLAPPATLLLELSSSLRLFGGVEALSARIVNEVLAQGFSVQPALAPTPLAAQWLAFASRPAAAGFPAVAECANNAYFVCRDLAALPLQLGTLPLSLLDLGEARQARLAAFGARTLADVLALPRAGLARRVGAGFAADLARALGERPDPRPRFAFPEHFREAIELPARCENAPALAFAARRLIAALCGWLAVRAAGIHECVLELRCERGSAATPALTLALTFAAATRDPARIARVLDERLARLQLPAPVESLCLRADAAEALAGQTTSLFAAAGSNSRDRSGDTATGVAELVERLQARLGEQCVYRLVAVPEHRPEKATQKAAFQLAQRAHAKRRKATPAGAGEPAHGAVPAPAAASLGARPLCLLPEPQALAEQGGRPQRGGPLRLVAGPERIESGWWDEGEPGAVGDVRRDYFIALSARAEWLWIFRSDAGWFLHGLFA